MMGLRTAQCKMLLFCAKAREGVRTSPPEERRRKPILAVWRLSGAVLSRCFLVILEVFLARKTLENEC